MAMFGRKTTECHQCEAWHKVKLVINGIAVIGGQCTQLVPAGDFCKDCDTNVTFPIYLEWRYSPQRDKFKLEREGSVVVIEDADILLFSNAIKKAIEDNPFIGKDIIGTKRIEDAPDCKKTLLQTAGFMQIRVDQQIQQLITVQTNELMAGTSKSIHGTTVVTKEVAAGMFKCINLWLSNLQVKVDSHGDLLCVHAQILNEVFAEQEGQKVLLADVKARQKDADESIDELRCQVSNLQAALLKQKMAGGPQQEQENQNPLQVVD